jgi:hypothetical protein
MGQETAEGCRAMDLETLEERRAMGPGTAEGCRAMDPETVEVFRATGLKTVEECRAMGRRIVECQAMDPEIFVEYRAKGLEIVEFRAKDRLFPAMDLTPGRHCTTGLCTESVEHHLAMFRRWLEFRVQRGRKLSIACDSLPFFLFKWRWVLFRFPVN